MTLFYGPRFWKASPNQVFLRSMTTDVETIVDMASTFIAWHRGDGDPSLRSEIIYEISRGPVAAEELRELGVHDRNTLVVHARLHRGSEIPYAMKLYSPTASVEVWAPSLDSVAEAQRIGDYLYKNSRVRPTWGRLRYLLPLVPLVALVAGYVGLVITTSMPPALHLLLAGVLVLAVAGSIAWSRRIYRDTREETSSSRPAAPVHASIRYRAQSRAQTYADRADRRANLRVGFFTALITLPLTVVATLLAAWFGGVLQLQ